MTSSAQATTYDERGVKLLSDKEIRSIAVEAGRLLYPLFAREGWSLDPKTQCPLSSEGAIVFAVYDTIRQALERRRLTDETSAYVANGRFSVMVTAYYKAEAARVDFTLPMFP